MKTAIKTLFATALTATVLISSAFSTSAKDLTPAQPDIKNGAAFKSAAANVTFNKVMVSGNAKVILVQGNREEINSFDEITENHTTVTIKGYTLYIHSNEDRPATIYVYVKDLQRITASNTASVKTKGNFDLKVLQIFLKDTAKANVNAKVGSLYTDMQGQASLKMSGSSSEQMMAGNTNSKVDLNDFIVLRS